MYQCNGQLASLGRVLQNSLRLQLALPADLGLSTQRPNASI